MKKKVVFLGSKPIGADCLKWVIENRDKLNIEIIAVATHQRTEFDHNETVLNLALKNNITVLDHLDGIPHCDIIYSVQHHEILRKEHIDKAKEIAVNLHLAPLPEYRGCNQFSFAILDDAKEFGVSIHKIDERIDHGDLLFENRFPIEYNIWVEDLYNKTVRKGYKLFVDTFESILNGEYILQDVTKLGRKQSIHYRNEIQQLKKISFDKTQNEITKIIRATSMPGFEMPFFEFDGEKIYIIRERYKNKI